MPVRFILGPSGSGKTWHCLTALREREASGLRAIYLVPEQFTFSADRELLADGDLPGLRHVRVFSFTRLAWWLRERSGTSAPPAIPEAVRPMLLRAVLAETDPETLGPLASLRHRHGFLEALSSFIAEVRNHGPVSFLEEVQRGAPSILPRGTRGKLVALAAVYEAYAGALRDLGRVDPEERLAGIETVIASQRDLLAGMSIFVDGFVSWTRREREVLVALALTGCRLEVALCGDPEEVELEDPGRAVRAPFHPVVRSHLQLRSALERAGVPFETPFRLVPSERPVRFRSPDLRRLERRFHAVLPIGGEEAEERERRDPKSAPHGPGEPEGSTPRTRRPGGESGLRLRAARDRRQEVVLWARTIDRWIRCGETMVRPSEVAVLLRDPEPYRDLVREIFPRYRIPFFLDERRRVIGHPRIRLLLGILETILSGWQRDRVIALLRNPLLGIPPASIDLLENLSLEYGRDFEAWYAPAWESYLLLPRARFDRSGSGEGQADSHGTDGEDEGGDWESEGDSEGPPDSPSPDTFGTTGGDAGTERISFVEDLRRRYLAPLVELQVRWGLGELPGREAAEVLRRCETALRGETSAPLTLDVEWTARVDETVERLLDEAAALWIKTPVRLDEFTRTLRHGFEAVRIGVTPQRLEEVMVSDVQRSRLQGIRRAILGGANEGIFPRAVTDDPVLTDVDREVLETCPVRLGPTARQRQEEELYLFYIALTRASDELLITWSQMDGSGKALAPSNLLDEVRRAIPEVRPEPPPPKEEDLAPDLLQTGWEIGERLVSDLSGRLGGGSSAAAQAEVLKALAGVIAAASPPTSAERPPVGAPLSVPEDPESEARLCMLTSLPAILYAPDPFLPGDLLARVFPGNDLVSSASRLQTFAQCPYRSFARDLLRLKPRPEAEVSPLETGTLAHAALERVLRRPPAPDLPSIRHHLADIFRELEGRPEFIAFRKDSASQYRWESTQGALSQYLRVEIPRLRGSAFAFEDSEVAFGFAEGDPPVILDLADGGRLLLRGRIDRIDLCPDPSGTMAMIIDYKRSPRSVKPPKGLREGTDLQLAVYLLFARDVRRWKTAAGLYVPVLPPPRRAEKLRAETTNPLDIKMEGFFLSAEGGRIDAGREMLVSRGQQKMASVQELDRLLDLARTWLTSYASTLRRGWIAPRPLQAGGNRLPCDNCDFPAVCRFRAGLDPVRLQASEGMLHPPAGVDDVEEAP